MTSKITGENKKIIKIVCKMIICNPEIFETLLHESLKYSRLIHEAKRCPYSLMKHHGVMKAVRLQISRLR